MSSAVRWNSVSGLDELIRGVSGALTSLVTPPNACWLPQLQEDPPQTERRWLQLTSPDLETRAPVLSLRGISIDGMERTGLGAGQARSGPHPGGRCKGMEEQGQGPAR